MASPTMASIRRPGKREGAVTKWIARFVALLCGCGIWLAVVSEEVISVTLTVPIVPFADRENLVWTGDTPGDAVIRVQGKARSLWWMEYVSPPEVRLSLSSLPASGEVALKADMVELPQRSDVKIIAILKPEKLPVSVEKYTTRILPVASQIQIEPEAGYVVAGGPASFPANVEARGKRSRLRELDSIRTEPKTLANIANSGSFEAILVSPKDVKLALNRVEMRYTIERLVEERIENVPVIMPKGWEADPPYVAIKVSGPGSRLLELRKRQPKVRIDNPATGSEVVPAVELPASVKLLSMTPATIKVHRR